MPEAPPCVGTYEVGHPTCDGDPAGPTEQDRAPCAWRNRCAGLQIYCNERAQAPDEVVAAVSFETLVQVCEGYVEAHQIDEGMPGGRPKPSDFPDAEPPKPTPAQLKKERKKKEQDAERQRRARRRKKAPQNKVRRKIRKPKGPLPEEVLVLNKHFETVLRDHFPERKFSDGMRVLVKPGVFYSIDRTKGSHYVSWYCTMPKGRDRALACIRFKPRLGCVDIELPVSLEELRSFLGKRAFKKLQIKEFKDGQFQSLCTKLDREGVALVAETIKRLAEVDLIPLPEP